MNFKIAGRAPSGSGPVFERRMSLSEQTGRYISQVELADESGVSLRAIVGHERAGTMPTRSLWVALCSVSADDLK